MKRRPPRFASSLFVPIVAFLLLAPSQAAAEKRFVARAANSAVNGLAAVNTACQLAGCSVKYGLDGDLGRVFLATTGDEVDANAFVVLLQSLVGLVENAEIDQVIKIASDDAPSAPPALLDKTPVSYFGMNVRGGYVRQPAFDIVGIGAAQSTFGLTGAGIIVAIIDTGVDVTHPVLRDNLITGYDFTRNRNGASERADLSDDQSTVGVLDDGGHAVWVNQSTVAVLDDQSTVGVLDQPGLDHFGHGTMVAGVVHLAAPRAMILPLKAFKADGTGYVSDVLRGVFQAVKDNAKVLNMSFSFNTSSKEVQNALKYAVNKGVIPVASTGNEGRRMLVYPAGLGNVIGVAATTDFDTLASFSNFGTDIAWIAAPGEAIVTLYPLGTYAAAWGTSFSAPFAAGAAALLSEMNANITQPQAKEHEGQATWITQEVARGRLDIMAALRAWEAQLRTLGLR